MMEGSGKGIDCFLKRAQAQDRQEHGTMSDICSFQDGERPLALACSLGATTNVTLHLNSIPH